MRIREIYEGWRNHLFPPEKLKDIIRNVSRRRRSVCDGCSYNSKFHKITIRMDIHCVECGCTLSAKTKCLSCSCPLDKWKAEITEEQEDEMINGKSDIT